MISPNWLVQSSAIGAAGILALGVGVWGLGALVEGVGQAEPSQSATQVIWVHGQQGARAAGTLRDVEGVAQESRVERARRLNAERAAERRAQLVEQRAFEAARQAANASETRAMGWEQRRAERQAELAAREKRAQQVRTHLFELYAGPQCVDDPFEPAEAPEAHEPHAGPDAFLHPASHEATELSRQKVEHSLERAIEEMQRAFTP